MTENSYSRRGFTLFEMLLVLAIVSAVMTVVLPSMSAGFGSLYARSAASGISSALSGARERSLRERGVYYAEVSGNTLVIRSADGKRTEHAISPEAVLDPAPVISFSPDGVSSGGEIRLRSGDIGYSVKVLATGRTSVEALK